MSNYENEVKKRWGNTEAYNEYAKKKTGFKTIDAELEAIFMDFASLLEQNIAFDSKQALILVRKIKNHITDNYYTCTDQILSYLGEMYVMDERFKENIDKHHPGTAKYVSDAIKIYCDKRQA